MFELAEIKMTVKNSIKVLDKGRASLIEHMGSDEKICQSARVSYQKGTKKDSDDETLIRFMMRNRHTSPFESAIFTFYIKAPIFVVRQWHRHRTWSFSEISGRYSELENEFYVPELSRLQKQSKSNKQGSSDDEFLEEEVKQDTLEMMKEENYASFDNYKTYLGRDLSRELARINLPLSTYTEMYATVDLHNLFHFLKLRLDSHAQWEIRQFAEAMFKLIQPIVPISCKAFEDYVLNSVTFSVQEINIIKTILKDEIERFMHSCDSFENLSKREVQEFKKKLGIE